MSCALTASELFAESARKPARVGVLSSTAPDVRSAYWEAFKNGMSKLGWTEGRDVIYVYRYTRGDSTRFEPLAIELVAEKPDLIYAGTQAAALAVKKATREIPIVFALASDPVASGLAASLAKPGGNATGLTGTGIDMRTKTLELLKEVRPQMRSVALLVSRGLLGQETINDIEPAARRMGITLETIVVANQDELEKALRSLAGKKVDGVVFQAAGMMARNKIAARLAELRLPAVYSFSEIVDSGGLLSYGADITGNYRRAAIYVDRILKGAKPADLPVEQPMTYELAVNVKTAHLGHFWRRVPHSVRIERS